MEKQQNTYRYLRELSKSNFRIAFGRSNIIGWETKNENGTYIGTISELLFDPQARIVLYFVIDLRDNGMHLGNKKVMFPIAPAKLHISSGEVVLPNIHVEQLDALPEYMANEIFPQTETQIRSVIGSPAALRMEQSISEFDSDQFWGHSYRERWKSMTATAQPRSLF